MSRAAFAPVTPCDPGTPRAALRRLCDQNGGIERTMVKLGLKKSTTYDFFDPQGEGDLSFARAAALTSPTAAAAAEYFALLAGGVFLPIAPEEATAATLCADDARAHGEATAAVVTALAEGKLNSTVSKWALEKIDNALRALTGLRAVIVASMEVKPTSKP